MPFCVNGVGILHSRGRLFGGKLFVGCMGKKWVGGVLVKRGKGLG